MSTKGVLGEVDQHHQLAAAEPLQVLLDARVLIFGRSSHPVRSVGVRNIGVPVLTIDAGGPRRGAGGTVGRHILEVPGHRALEAFLDLQIQGPLNLGASLELLSQHPEVVVGRAAANANFGDHVARPTFDESAGLRSRGFSVCTSRRLVGWSGVVHGPSGAGLTRLTRRGQIELPQQPRAVGHERAQPRRGSGFGALRSILCDVATWLRHGRFLRCTTGRPGRLRGSRSNGRSRLRSRLPIRLRSRRSRLRREIHDAHDQGRVAPHRSRRRGQKQQSAERPQVEEQRHRDRGPERTPMGAARGQCRLLPHVREHAPRRDPRQARAEAGSEVARRSAQDRENRRTSGREPVC